MKKLIMALALVFFCGCAGREPNTEASHQLGDYDRTCESLRLEIAQNEVVINEKLKKDKSKFWTNTAWFIVLPFVMDVKEAEKVEAESLQRRNEYLKILMTEKRCGATAATDPNEAIQKSRKFKGYHGEQQPDGTLKLTPVYEDVK
jgi:hypothetical protein